MLMLAVSVNLLFAVNLCFSFQDKKDNKMLYQAIEALKLSEEIGDRLWPGYKLKEIPIAIYSPGGEAFLINHPSPPSGFEEVETSYSDEYKIYYTEKTNMFDAATATMVNGVLTAVIPCQKHFEKLSGKIKPTEEQIGTIFHEAFHVFQDNWKFPPINYIMFNKYPVFSAINNTLGNLEGKILAKALLESDISVVKSLARKFLAVRNERQSKFDRDMINYENGIELLEGLAFYIHKMLNKFKEESIPLTAKAISFLD